jgi:hypothetical protein
MNGHLSLGGECLLFDVHSGHSDSGAEAILSFRIGAAAPRVFLCRHQFKIQVIFVTRAARGKLYASIFQSSPRA